MKKKTKKVNYFFIIIAIIVAIIGIALVIHDLRILFSVVNGGLSSNFVLGITLIYESLMIASGRIPKIRV